MERFAILPRNKNLSPRWAWPPAGASVAAGVLLLPGDLFASCLRQAPAIAATSKKKKSTKSFKLVFISFELCIDAISRCAIKSAPSACGDGSNEQCQKPDRQGGQFSKLAAITETCP